MELKLYNTLTRTKAPFVPLDPANVRMYVCGPTVYDFAHIGNARPIIVFDVLFRLLRHLYGADRVTYVRNITDVDDKIIARAGEEGVSADEVTARTIAQFHKDVAALGCLTPSVEPRATGHIVEMKAMVERLIDRGCAYVAEDHVLFSVAAMTDYGALSNRSVDEMLAGARVEVAPYKRDPMDFVLWKPAKPGEPAWPSPAGIETPGRPGWHLECSAMSDRWLWQEAQASLGEAGRAHPHQFDIHGGGIDLAFPHHENEIAQSRCCFGTPKMASVWMHNGFLQVEGRKMAKSEGNFVTIRELLNDWPGEVLRLNMLRTHYRQPIDWTLKGCEEASRVLDGWHDAAGDEGASDPVRGVVEALADDLNTPAALAELHRLAADGAPGRLRASANLLGLLTESNTQWVGMNRARLALDENQVAGLITARLAARKAKNFAEADRIRDELAGMGIRLKDSKDTETGEPVTSWEVAR